MAAGGAFTPTAFAETPEQVGYYYTWSNEGGEFLGSWQNNVVDLLIIDVLYSIWDVETDQSNMDAKVPGIIVYIESADQSTLVQMPVMSPRGAWIYKDSGNAWGAQIRNCGLVFKKTQYCKVYAPPIEADGVPTADHKLYFWCRKLR